MEKATERTLLSLAQQSNVVRLPVPEGKVLHTAILGMIDLLPRIGEGFPVEQRVIWLRTMAGIFQLVYGLVGDISVKDVTTPKPPKSLHEPWP